MLGSKATLRLGIHSFCKQVKVTKCNAGEQLASDVKERDAAIIIAVTAIALVLVQGCDNGISHLLGDCSLLPALAQQLMERVVRLVTCFCP